MVYLFQENNILRHLTIFTVRWFVLRPSGLWQIQVP